MTKGVRPRRHSLANPLALGGQQPFHPSEPFMDLRSPHLCRPKPSSPVDSVLKPDLRFPQGEAEAGGRLAGMCADEDQKRRERSKSVGGRASLSASPSLEDVEKLLALTHELKLPWPVAPAPSLVEAYGVLREGLKALRVGCIHLGHLAREVSGGDGVGPAMRGLARAGVAVEIALLPVIFPPPPKLIPEGDKAADLITPDVARQLADRVHAAAAAIERARNALGGWRDRCNIVGDCEVQIETDSKDAEFLSRGVTGSMLRAEAERAREQAVNQLVDGLLPGHMHAVNALARDVCELLRDKGLCHEVEPVMAGAWPEPQPGEEYEGPPRGTVDQRQLHEPKILCAESAYESLESEPATIRTAAAATAPSETAFAITQTAAPAPAAGGDDGASRYPGGTASPRHRIRWAYLRLCYRSRGRRRRVDHQAALEAFCNFQCDLNASLAVAEQEPGRNAATKRLLAKVVARVEGHNRLLNRKSPPQLLPPSGLSREEDTKEEEDDDKMAVPSTIGVFFGDDACTSDDGWAAQLSASLLRVGSSNGLRSGKETGEHKREDGRGYISSRDGSPSQPPLINLMRRTCELT